MPLLTLKTNIALSQDQQHTLLPRLSRAVAELLGKAERYVMVSLDTEAPMSFAGTTEPAAYLELKSIGLPQEQTRTYSQALCDLVEQHLHIPRDRVYIEFSDAPRPMWGWNGTTFER
ncbi:MAG: phenylpyruvate tautomerase MIF-related protein [Gammaproteobacteria bacterium]